MEDRAKIVSELYQMKVSLQRNISRLDKVKVIGGYKSINSCHIQEFEGNFPDLNETLKEFLTQYYEQKILEIDQNLDQLLKS